MEHRPLGKSGLIVPVIGMGSWKSLDVQDPDDRRDLVDTAIANGTTLFDTSPMYAASERVLGTLLKGRRDTVIVADKVWTPSLETGRTQIDNALAWYDGNVDIYQVHNLVAWKEHLPVLEDLKARGAVKVVGATHYQHSAFPELMTVMQTGRLGMIQIPYNAADHTVDREVLPLAQELGLGVLVMEPLGSGKLMTSPPGPAVLQPLERFGVRTWGQALLKWILSDPRVHCVIPATSKPARAAENAEAGDGAMFDEETREYDARLARG